MMSNACYSVRVKNGSGWRQFNRVRLMISVGQEYHEGNKLAAVVDWINRNPSIEEVHVSVNDYLQRHNYYAQGFPKEQGDAIALAEGVLWLERNRQILSGIRPHVFTTRWNNWYGNAAYQTTRAILEKYAADNPEFSLAIASDAAAIAARRMNRGENIPASLTSFSSEYLKEELSVFALQTKGFPAAEVYPGSNLGAAKFLLEKDLPVSLAPLSHRYFTRIDFARIHKPNFAPTEKILSYG